MPTLNCFRINHYDKNYCSTSTKFQTLYQHCIWFLLCGNSKIWRFSLRGHFRGFNFIEDDAFSSYLNRWTEQYQSVCANFFGKYYVLERMGFLPVLFWITAPCSKMPVELRVAPSVVTDALFWGMDIELAFFLCKYDLLCYHYKNVCR